MIPTPRTVIWNLFPKGGMHQITKSLESLAVDIGIKFNFNNKVDEIMTKNLKSMVLRLEKNYSIRYSTF